MDHVMEAAAAEIKTMPPIAANAKLAFDVMALSIRYFYSRIKDKVLRFQDLGKNTPVGRTNKPAAKALYSCLEE